MAERWVKSCTCRCATASSPRVVEVGPQRVALVWHRFRRVRLACDVCDTPWVQTTPAAPEGAGADDE